jgi:hypothetical protein
VEIVSSSLLIVHILVRTTDVDDHHRAGRRHEDFEVILRHIEAETGGLSRTLTSATYSSISAQVLKLDLGKFTIGSLRDQFLPCRSKKLKLKLMFIGSGFKPPLLARTIGFLNIWIKGRVSIRTILFNCIVSSSLSFHPWSIMASSFAPALRLSARLTVRQIRQDAAVRGQLNFKWNLE